MDKILKKKIIKTDNKNKIIKIDDKKRLLKWIIKKRIIENRQLNYACGN